MMLPNRNGSTPEYRYGFNGMEKDDEVKTNGNSYDFGARIYDPRVGRWLTRDPKEIIYSHLSPYNYCGDNPITWIDKDGEIIRDPKGNIVYVKLGDTQMEHAGAPGVKVDTEFGYIFANDGTPILVMKNDNKNGYDTDCHGVTFTKGEFWIDNNQVPQLIKSEGLVEVAYADRMENDKVFYTPDEKEIVDSRTVTSDIDIVYGQGGIEINSYKAHITKAWPKSKRPEQIRIFRSTQSDVIKDQSSIDKLLKRFKPTTQAELDKINNELNSITKRSPNISVKTIIEPKIPMPTLELRKVENIDTGIKKEVVPTPAPIQGEKKKEKK